jgi:Zn ribbon nucleic-acid-binding protein
LQVDGDWSSDVCSSDLYLGAGSQIRGDFSIRVTGPEEQIASVTFLIDGQPMGEVAQTPFRLRFKTTSYPAGIHELSARVTLKDGQQLSLGPTRFEFVTSEQQGQGMQKILIPLLGIVLAAMLIGFGAQYLTMRGKPGSVEPGTPRNYGIAGGAICPRCKRPTPRHMWGLNLVAGRLHRCENCGRWSIMRAAPIDVLRAAERAELEAEKQAAPVPEKSEEEKLKELLDKSKYVE